MEEKQKRSGKEGNDWRAAAEGQKDRCSSSAHMMGEVDGVTV